MTRARPLRVMVIDDEAPARNRLRDLLGDCALIMPLEIAGEADNGRRALDLLPSCNADVVLLDIRMPDMDGIEVAQHLQKLETPPAVIFTTAYDAYALKAFEVHAIDYLLKPIRVARLLDALSRARAIAPLRPEVLDEIRREGRSHRNCLVAKDAIRGFERASAVDVDGESDGGWTVVLNQVSEKLPVSRRQQHIVREFGRIL